MKFAVAAGLLAIAAALFAPTADAVPARTMTTSEVIHRLNGSPKWKGSISASTSVANLALSYGGPHIINCGAAAYFRADDNNGTATTSSTNMGLPIEANKNVYFTPEASDTKVYVILGSGTTTCNVWEVR